MILAINTAFMEANVGLILNDGKRIERTIDAKSKHSENVLKTTDEVCTEAGVNINDIENFAVVVGPGSFTGIRIGVAIIKAIAVVNEKAKFFPVSSLELMAYIYSQKNNNSFATVLNALSNLFFVAEFDKNGIKLKEERMIERCELEKIKERKVCLKGDLVLENADYIEITTHELLNFALSLVENGKSESIENVNPLYLRPSQAEANLKSVKKVWKIVDKCDDKM